MTLVLRIENEKGEGPWSGYSTINHPEFDFALNGARVYDVYRREGTPSCYDMPDPTCEPYDTPLHQHSLRTGLTGYLFAFTSISQLVKAFRSKKGRAALQDAGFRLSVYEVPERYTFKGTRQVVFREAEAILVEVLDLATFEHKGIPE